MRSDFDKVKSSKKAIDFDDDTLESLKRYFGVDEPEYSELIKYIKVSRLISEPEDWNEKLAT